MAEAAVALATVLAAAVVVVLSAFAVRRLGASHRGLSGRGVAWATSFGISVVLSVVLSFVLTTINVGLISAFPAAFLRSVLIGIVVATPTAYVTVPWVRGLTEPLGVQGAPTADPHEREPRP